MTPTALYSEQCERWPSEGRHIMAAFDDESVVVYQAYRPSIGHWAAEHGHFGGQDFGFGRMSWVKPNFLWMMYRSGWATKPGQEVVLALRVPRDIFDGWLACAVPSGHDRELYASREEWQHAVKRSDVRLQWDPDHDPSGAPVARRAIQLGLRGGALGGFRGEALLGVEDITSFVEEQRDAAHQPGWQGLVTPAERPYPLSAETRRHLRAP